jgi:hypothetical protein
MARRSTGRSATTRLSRCDDVRSEADGDRSGSRRSLVPTASARP